MDCRLAAKTQEQKNDGRNVDYPIHFGILRQFQLLQIRRVDEANVADLDLIGAEERFHKRRKPCHRRPGLLCFGSLKFEFGISLEVGTWDLEREAETYARYQSHAHRSRRLDRVFPYSSAEMKALLVRARINESPVSDLFAWRFVAIAVLFGLLWLEVINQLKAEWSLNPQYGYGWSVPFLALYLFWRRWPHRPAPASARRKLPGQLSPATAAAICAFLFLPLRFVAEANPDSRLISWALALVAISLTLRFLFLMGGWPGLRHFAFPVVFFLVALPWPTRLEQLIVQNLMRAVTGINVAMLNTVGIPALQLGNVIEVGAGLIGIEEACSGVRSVPGDAHGLTFPRRALRI
jgi:exosortase